VKCAGASLDAVAKKFSVSRDAVFRHHANHVTEDARSQYLADVPIAELAALAASEGTSVLEYLSLVRSVLVQEFQLAAQTHSHHATATLAGRLNEILRSIGQLSGEMSEVAARSSVTITGGVVNILNDPRVAPQLADFQARLLQALQPYPSAHQAVVAVIRAYDAESAPTAVPLMKTIEHHVET
jgi:hypothetical protein